MASRRFRFLRRRMRRHARRAALFFFGLGFLAGGAGLAIWKTDIGAVRGIVVEGTEFLSAAEIEGAAREAMSAPILGPLPGNFLVFSPDRVAATMFERFPRIAAVSVRRNFRDRTVVVSLRERKIAGVFCAAERLPNDVTGAQGTVILHSCFLIDREGIAFADMPETEGTLLLVIADTSNPALRVGEAALSPEAFATIEHLWQLFRDTIRVGIRLMVIEADGTVRAETFEGWEAIFAVDRDAEAQVVALRELLEKQLPRDKRRGIDFIDLRTPGKIFYR